MSYYNDTRAFREGGNGYSEDAASWNTAIKGSLVGRKVLDCSMALNNISSATDLHIAYVDAGKSLDDDWSFSFQRLDAKQQKPANSMREFSIGEDMKTSYTTGTGVLAWTSVSGQYYIIKIITPTAQTATLVKCTYQQKSTKTSATVLSLKAGENTFIVLANDTATTLTLGTADASALTAVYSVTAWTLGQCEINY